MTLLVWSWPSGRTCGDVRCIRVVGWREVRRGRCNRLAKVPLGPWDHRLSNRTWCYYGGPVVRCARLHDTKADRTRIRRHGICLRLWRRNTHWPLQLSVPTNRRNWICGRVSRSLCRVLVRVDRRGVELCRSTEKASVGGVLLWPDLAWRLRGKVVRRRCSVRWAIMVERRCVPHGLYRPVVLVEDRLIHSCELVRVHSLLVAKFSPSVGLHRKAPLWRTSSRTVNVLFGGIEELDSPFYA